MPVSDRRAVPLYSILRTSKYTMHGQQWFGTDKILLAFGKEDFKGKQKEIVEAAVRGADVFVSAPTGMGKVRGV